MISFLELSNPQTHKAHRFTVLLADGTTVTGPVQGNGGVLTRKGGFGRLSIAIVHAEEGFPTGLFEPKKGFARVYPDYDFMGFGVPVDINLKGAEVVS